MFQLHSRLRQAGLSQAPMAGSSTSDSFDNPSDNPVAKPGAQEAPPRLKGRLYRNWTHNEQLFVRCCGVIISRATFFGSEGVSGINVCIITCCILWF
jgi:hypothetical protein